jgi:hypothetical protein
MDRGVIVEQGNFLHYQGLYRERQIIDVVVKDCKPKLLGTKEPGKVVRPSRVAKGPQVSAIGCLRTQTLYPTERA